MVSSIEELAGIVLKKQKDHDGNRLFTVAISGIDASGKGYNSSLLKDKLEERGYKTALLNIDPWQNSIPIRLRKEDSAMNFYHHAFRWNDFFEQLFYPLQTNRGIDLQTKGLYSHADEYYDLHYDYENCDILLAEGIFLFKKEFLSCYDLKVWIDCSFTTGLARAIRRNVEKLDEASLIRDYQTYYYPAQQIHFEKDDPVSCADILFDNEHDSVKSCEV